MAHSRGRIAAHLNSPLIGLNATMIPGKPSPRAIIRFGPTFYPSRMTAKRAVKSGADKKMVETSARARNGKAA